MRVLRLMTLCAVTALPVLLAGCGFVPLYAQQGLTANLSQVAIETPDTRTGFFLGKELKNSLGEDTSKERPYKLTVTVAESHYGVGYRVDDTSTRSELTANIGYVLKDMKTQRRLTQGNFTETVTYNASSSPFTGIVSQQGAQERVAANAAQKIQTDLAIYFRQTPR